MKLLGSISWNSWQYPFMISQSLVKGGFLPTLGVTPVCNQNCMLTYMIHAYIHISFRSMSEILIQPRRTLFTYILKFIFNLNTKWNNSIWIRTFCRDLCIYHVSFSCLCISYFILWCFILFVLLYIQVFQPFNECYDPMYLHDLGRWGEGKGSR